MQPTFDAAFQSEFEELLRWRRDVRRFRPDPVPPALMDKLLQLACLAPSVGFSQPWRFVRVQDPARRAKIRNSFESCNADALSAQTGERAALYVRLKLAGLDEAPEHLAVFCEPDPITGHGLGRRTMPETVVYSTVAAIQSLWLAARAHGLGVGWVSILDPEVVATALDIPDQWLLVAYLCLGTPASEDDAPVLEREGWESRMRLEDVLFFR